MTVQDWTKKFAEGMNRLPRRVEADGVVRHYENNELVREEPAQHFCVDNFEYAPIELPKDSLP